MTPVWILLIATVLICSHFISCEPEEDPPRIETYPKDQTVASGGIAVFVCTAVGNPNPQIKWRKNGKKMKTQRYTTWDIPNGSVLRIEPVRAGRDDATYECVAKNGVGEPVRALADLNVLPEDSLPDGFPRFIRQPNMQGINEGRSALLPCQAEGDPEPTIKWLKNMIPLDMTIPRYSLVQGSSLQITDAEEEDQGNYECMAENTHGSALSEMTTLFVRVRRVPPYFSIPPENLYEVMPGSSLNLTCVAGGSPMPFVKWRKGLMDITPDHTIPIGRNVLVLTDISESNNYTCIAASKLGNIETTAQVFVQALPRPPTNVRISDVTATSVRLSWSYDIGSENIIYYVIQYKPKQANQEYSEKSGITTMFYTVQDLSPYTEYEFYVIAVNGIGRGSPSTPVVATTGETALPRPPTNVRISDVTATSVRLSWSYDIGSENIIYYVIQYKPKQANQEYSEKSGITTMFYTVRDLSPYTEYEFYVIAVNGIGRGSPSTPVVATTGETEDSLPDGFPRFIRQPNMQGINEGRSALLPCQAEGDPEPTIKWLKNMIPLDMTIPRYSLVQGSSLQITDAEEEDQGNYECMAENIHGSALSEMATLFVRVRRVPPYFSIPPENLYEVMPGSSLNLTCVAGGSPMPFVKWRKGLMDSTPDHTIPIGRNVLVLTDISESNNYTCIAASKLGNIETTAQVFVQALPRPPTNVRISDVTATSVRLSWSYAIGSENIIYYVIQYKPKQANQEYSEKSGITTMFYTVRDLSPYTEYEFYVIAVNGIGRGSPSTPVIATTGETGLPRPPTNVRISDVTATSVRLSWWYDIGSENIIYYVIQYKPKQANQEYREISGITTMFYTVRDLSPYTEYEFYVIAVNGSGRGPPSTPVVATTGETEDSLPDGFPRFIRQPNMQGINEGRSALLPCQAEGDPEPTIKWLKNMIPLDMTIPRYSLVQGSSLQITDAEEEDQGNYECMAENTHGSALSEMATLFVRVRRVPPYFSIPPENLYEVMPGSSLNITCVAVGSPMPFVKWRKGLMDITPDHTIPIGRNVLVLTDISESNNYTCIAASKLGNIETTAQVFVQALPRPPTNVRISDVTATSVRLSWSYDISSENIIYYVIQYKPKQANQEYSVKSGITTMFYTVRDLSPYTEYEFYVIAVNGIGRGSPSTPVIATTGETALPRPPTNVRISDVTATSVRLSWSYDIGSENIIYYVIQYKPKQANQEYSEKSGITTMFYTVRDLSPYTEYEFYVIAVNGIGRGSPSTPVIATTGETGLPRPPTNVRISDVTATSVRLSWWYDIGSENIIYYVIQYKPKQANQEYREISGITTMFYTVRDLSPYTEYEFYVIAVNGSGRGPPSTPVVATTGETEDSLPDGFPRFIRQPNMQGINESRSALLPCQAEGDPEPTIKWLKNKIPLDMTIPRYSLVQGSSLQITDAEEEDQGNYECMAENTHGSALSVMATVFVRVRRVPPYFSIPPENLYEVMPGSSLNLTCVAGGSPMPFVKWRKGLMDITPDHTIPIGRNVLVLTDISESNNYTCIAASKLGNIETTAQVFVQALPRPPTNVRISDVTATSVRLSWSYDIGSENIIYYVIQYKPKQANQEYSEKSGITTMFYTVRDLSPYTEYEFYVIAVNGIGRGSPSTPVVATTGETALPRPPTNFRISDVTATSVRLSWSYDIGSENIIYYVIQYKPKQANQEYSEKSGITTMFHTVRDLSPYTEYEFYVIAVNGIGRGSPSTSVVATTGETVRRVPPYFSIRPENLYEVMPGSSLNITCVAVGSPMPFVKWRKGLMDITPDHTTPIGRNVLVLTDISESNNYTCIAASKLGNVETTAQVFVQALPRPPTNVRISDVTATSVRLSWSYDIGSENIIYYVIQYKPQQANQEYSEKSGITTMFYTVRDLSPYTEYEFYVIAVNGIGRGSPSTSVVATTGETVRRVPPYFSIRPENLYEVMPGSSLNLTCVAAGSPMPFVKWRKGLMDITPDHTIPIGRNVLVLTDISESNNYTCIAASKLGNIETTAQVFVQALPRPPTNVRISDVTATSVRLSWSYDIGSENIICYVIQYKPKQANQEYSEISGITTMFYTVRDLSPYTEYEFYVIAVNGIGRGSPSTPVVTTTGETGHALASQLANLYMDSAISAVQYALQNEKLEPTRLSEYTYIYKDKDNGVDGTVKYFEGSLSGLSKVERHSDCDGPRTISGTTAIDCTLVFDRLLASHKGKFSYGLHEANINVKGNIHSIYIKVGIVKSISERNPQVKSLYFIKYGSMDTYFTGLGPLYNQTKVLHDIYETVFKTEAIISIQSGFRKALNVTVASLPMPVD